MATTPTIVVGRNNWGIKNGNLLGYYQSDDGFFVKREFTATRGGGTNGTFVGSNGLIQTAASGNLPRIDFADGSPALLVEPAATNLVLHNNDFGNAYWTKVNTTTASSADPVVGTQWQVTDSLDILPQIHYVWRDGGITAGATACGSKIYAKAGTLSRIRLSQTGVPGAQNSNQSSADINLSNGQVIQSATDATFVSVKPMINGWYEIEVGTNGTLSNSRYSVIVLNNLGNSTYQGDGTGTVFIARAMKVNNTLICGSDIPTTTGSVIRNADVISLTGATDYIGQTQGTIYAEVGLTEWTNGKRIFAISDGTQDNRIAFLINTTNRIRALVTQAGATQADINTSTGLANGIYKIALAYAANDFALYVNGTQIGTDTNGTVPACTDVYVGKIETSSTTLQINDRIITAAIYNKRLPNDQLQALTTL
jgi:hypothetical protein